MIQASMLKVKDLKVNYGGIEALKGISFDVEQGQIVTLIGANGAGKSTTMNMICSIVRPTAGSVLPEILSSLERLPRKKYLAGPYMWHRSISTSVPPNRKAEQAVFSSQSSTKKSVLSKPATQSSPVWNTQFRTTT